MWVTGGAAVALNCGEGGVRGGVTLHLSVGQELCQADGWGRQAVGVSRGGLVRGSEVGASVVRGIGMREVWGV